MVKEDIKFDIRPPQNVPLGRSDQLRVQQWKAMRAAHDRERREDPQLRPCACEACKPSPY